MISVNQAFKQMKTNVVLQRRGPTYRRNELRSANGSGEFWNRLSCNTLKELNELNELIARNELIGLNELN